MFQTTQCDPNPSGTGKKNEKFVAFNGLPLTFARTCFIRSITSLLPVSTLTRCKVRLAISQPTRVIGIYIPRLEVKLRQGYILANTVLNI